MTVKKLRRADGKNDEHARPLRVDLDHLFDLLDPTQPLSVKGSSCHTYHSSTVNPPREAYEPTRSTLEAELLRVLAGMRCGNWPSKDELEEIYADPYLASVAHVVAMSAKRMLANTGYEMLKSRRVGRKYSGVERALRRLVIDIARDSGARPGEQRLPVACERTDRRCSDVGVAYAHSAYLLLNGFLEHDGRVGEAWADVSISEVVQFAVARKIFGGAASLAFEMYDELHPNDVASAAEE